MEEARKSEAGPDEVPELNLMGKSRVVEYLKKMATTLNKVSLWQTDFKNTNDKRTEDRLRENIKIAFEQISCYINNSNLALECMQKESERLKIQYEDPEGNDTNIRILSLNTALLMKKIYLLLRTFNSLQIDVKKTYQDKMKRHILVFDPNMDEVELKELTNDPIVG